MSHHRPKHDVTNNMTAPNPSVRLDSISMKSVNSMAPSPRSPRTPGSLAEQDERYYNPMQTNNHHSSKIMDNFRSSFASYSDH